MNKILFTIGLIILIVTILAYVVSPFGDPINIFWVPFGILSLVLLVVGIYKEKK